MVYMYRVYTLGQYCLWHTGNKFLLEINDTVITSLLLKTI